MTGHDEPPKDAIAAARELTGAVKGLRTDLDDKFAFLRHYGKVNRVLAVITIVSLVLDLVLTGLFVSDEIQLRAQQAQIARNTASVTQVHEANLHACQGANSGLAVQEAVWNKLVALSPAPPKGSKDARLLGKFTAFYKHAYAPRDCAKLYPPPATRR